MEISFRPNYKQLERMLSEAANKQLPYATATALTELAKQAQASERDNLDVKLENPTPFTKNSIRVRAARKDDLEAVLYVQDIAAAYLEPYEFGGMHKLIGRGVTWWNPKHIQLDQFGNIPKNALKALMARSDVFVGKVKTKQGMVDGVWWRSPKPATAKRRLKRGALKHIQETSRSKAIGSLVLIARFGDARPVKQRLNYREVAQQLMIKRFDKEMGRALAKAMASAR